MRVRWVLPAFALILPGICGSFACGLDDTAIEAFQGSSPGADASIDGTASGEASARDATNGDAPANVDASSDATIVSTMLVYANTQTDLYSFDVLSLTLTHLGALSGCGSNVNDIALAATGQLFIFESNDAIYQLALDGTCSGRNVLDSFASDILKISGRNAGTPDIVDIDTSHEDYYSLDPLSASQATVTKITNNLFPGSPKFDIVCASDGTCWTALDHSHCSAGSSSSCLYSFEADGSGTPTLLGAINVHPNGLAYANGSLYGFDDDGAIAKISLGASPVASVFSPSLITLAGGASLPDAWNGATSSSAYTHP